MRYPCYLLLFTFILSGCSFHKNPTVRVDTSIGSFTIELYADKAPKSVAAFLANVEKGIYKNSSFYWELNAQHRPNDSLLKAHVIVGGIAKTKHPNWQFTGIPHETTRQTSIFNKEGVIAFARKEPGSATTEFVISIVNNPGLDYGGDALADKQGYAAFGKVSTGMNTVQRIFLYPDYEQWTDPSVPIKNITLVKD